MSARDDMPILPSEALSADPAPTRVLRLEGFEPAVPVDPSSRDAYERRFVTLFEEGGAVRHGGLGEVRRVTNIWGEAFALKTLAAPLSPSTPQDDASRKRREAAFRREYRLQARVSGLKGFPRVYGIGRVEGAPALLMEWVEGITLSKAARMLAVDDDGRVSPLNVARIGRDLFELLARLDVVESGIVHGDISCGNVMVRTDRLPLAEQAEEGVFDLCLIDFGSARFIEGRTDAEGECAPTGSATVEYAAPEVVDPNGPSRKAAPSPASDVFAAAGVLFRLATGSFPFRVDAAMERAEVARVKTRQAPAPLRTAHASDDIAAALLHEPEVAVAVKLAQDETKVQGLEAARLALVQVDALLDPILLACLSPDPALRPRAAEARDALGAFAFHYADNVRRSLRGEPLTPCVPGSLADGYGAALRERSRVVRAAGKALCAFLAVVVAATAGLLVASVPAAYDCAAASLTHGPVAGCATAAALLLPFAVGLLVRWRDDGSAASLARGGAGLLAGILLSVACFMMLEPRGSDILALAGAALAATSAAGLCWLLSDFAAPRLRRSRSQGRMAALPAGSPRVAGTSPRELEGRIDR